MSYTASPDALMTLHGFNAALGEFAKKLDLAPKIVTQRIAADLHKRITEKTPVDTGRARASWDVKQAAPSEFQPEPGTHAGAKDVSGAIAEITGKAPVFVTTAIDYMKYLEDGSSSQAPAGMVRIAIAEIEIEVEDVLATL